MAKAFEWVIAGFISWSKFHYHLFIMDLRAKSVFMSPCSSARWKAQISICVGKPPLKNVHTEDQLLYEGKHKIWEEWKLWHPLSTFNSIVQGVTCNLFSGRSSVKWGGGTETEITLLSLVQENHWVLRGVSKRHISAGRRLNEMISQHHGLIFFTGEYSAVM